MEIIETIDSFPSTGNVVFDYLFMGLMLFVQAYIWCIDKILKYPILNGEINKGSEMRHNLPFNMHSTD